MEDDGADWCVAVLTVSGPHAGSLRPQWVGRASPSGVIREHWPTRWSHSLERKSVAAPPLSRTVVSASNGDDDLATRLAVSEVPVAARHLFERERPVHNGSDGARFEQPPQLLQVLSSLL